MSNYYFLAPFLPPLSFTEKPAISFEEFKDILRANLTEKDWKLAQILLHFTDITNIRALLLEEPIDKRGSLNEKELDEAILLKTGLPDYVFDFLSQFETTGDKVKNFHGVLAQFFLQEVPEEEGFLKDYLEFERKWRLVLVALRAKLLGRDLIRELQFEDPTDFFVAQILAQRDSEDYQPPDEFADLKELIDSCHGDPWKEYQSFAKYRFDKIAEMASAAPFSIGYILAYMAQLAILEYDRELDQAKGKMILDTFKVG